MYYTIIHRIPCELHTNFGCDNSHNLCKFHTITTLISYESGLKIWFSYTERIILLKSRNKNYLTRFQVINKPKIT
jgi:hypothetical protein